jgi:hypothetical protein
VRAYAEETNRQNHERRAQAETSRRALGKIDKGIKGILDAIEDGMYQPAMKARMSELEQQKAEIEARLSEAPADVPDVHPNIAEHYRAKVIRLAETLAEPESNGEAREDIRSLIGEVVITPGEKRGESHATLRGELMAILDLAAGRRISPKTEVITNTLACPRNHRYRHSRSDSFRRAGTAPSLRSRMPENATAFAANPGVIDLLACWCGAGWKRPTHSFRRDDCF